MSIPAVALALATGGLVPAGPATVSTANVAADCQWPSVVSYRAGENKCSGILVHPRLIVTAAHCLADAGPGKVRFGEQFQPARRIVDTERCAMHPEYVKTGAPSADLGYCVLVEPEDDIPLTPLTTACENGQLQEGQHAVIVGFGATEQDPHFGTKRYAFTVLDSAVRSDGTVWVGDALVNGCLGDSGGPSFVQRADGTWHALGVLAYGPECGQGPVLYRTLSDRIDWLEAETGFDLAPCLGEGCESIASDPLEQDRSWVDGCEGARVPPPACVPADSPAPDSEGSTTEDDGGSEGSSQSTAAAADDSATGCQCRSSAGPDERAPTAWWGLAILGYFGRRRLSSATRCRGSRAAPDRAASPAPPVPRAGSSRP
ncbi:MAG: trypsin-like serine protease [Myxococcota bacterium]